MFRIWIAGYLLVSGFLFSAFSTTISGTVTDSVSGTKIADVIVSLRPTTGGGGNLPRDTTDAAGAYSLAGANTPGDFTVRASVSGYVVKNSAITVDTTKPTMALDFALVKIDTASVAGTITDSVAGTPIAGARVTLSGNSKVDTTQADGKYVFDKVATGTYSVTASALTYVSKTVSTVVSGTAAITANVALAKIAYATVSGTVADSAAPTTMISGSIVSLRSGNATVKLDTTGADGKYSFDSVATGSYTVRATAVGFQTRTSATTAVNGTAATVNVLLVQIVYGSVVGTVTDSVTPATLVSGAIISLRSGYTTVKRDTTGVDGKYGFDSVVAGAYTVSVTATGYNAKTSATITVTGAASTADIQLVKIVYGTVVGTVTDSVTPATLVSGAIVALRSGNTTVKLDTTGADGKYGFDSVAVGTYTVRATVVGYVTKTVNAAVTGSAAVTADIALVKMLYGKVSGTILDSVLGTPLAGAIVSVRSGYAPIKIDTTGADGKYAFDSIPTGVYTIRATDSSYAQKNTIDTVKASASDVIGFSLAKAVSRVVSRVVDVNKGTIFSITSRGEIVFSSISSPTEIAVFSMNGKLLCKSIVNQQNNRVSLPANVAIRGNAYVFSIKTANVMVRKTVMIP